MPDFVSEIQFRVSVVKDRHLVITSPIMDVNHQKMVGLELN